MMTFRLTLSLLLAGSWFSPASAYECQVETYRGRSNYGESIAVEALENVVTPFSVGEHGAVVAFDEDNCIQMCCELTECYVAVFDHGEALCYLKGEAAMGAENVVADGFTTYYMKARGGDASPIVIEPTECQSKRGVAFDFQNGDDLDALAPGMSWWYNWSPALMSSDVKAAQAASGCEYIPMIWGNKDMTRLENLDAMDQCSSLLSFNEPNFGSQADLSPTEAAGLWSTVKEEASRLGAHIVSPAVNFCGGDCNREDPYKWLDDFFVACKEIDGGCGVTAIAVHSYTCEVQYLNSILHGYEKYELPLWLTEFACADELDLMNEAHQASFLSDAMTLLELHPSVARYAWFTGRDGDVNGVAGADLLSGIGQLTTVGEIFVNTYKDLQRCDSFTSTMTSATYATNTEVDCEIVEPGTTMGLGDVDPGAVEITNAVIGNVGGSGTYTEVMSMAAGENMQCTDTVAACVKEDYAVSGPLAPFDEDVSVAFRGPMNLHNIAWFEGEKDSLTKTSSWTPTSSDNLVFMTNKGGEPGCAGEWTICGGSSQTYADETGSGCASEPTQFSGKLEGDQGVNIMSGTECADETSCGFYRNTGMKGWKGGSDGTKVMVFEVDMPHCGDDGFGECEANRPAVWALNSKASPQYGCNCRGVGGNGGCGEFDIVEAVIGSEYSDMLFTTVYDFKGTGACGQSKYFLRPSMSAHYAVVFRGGDDAYLQVVQLTDFDYSGTESLPGSFLDWLKESSSENHDIYNVNGPAGKPLVRLRWSVLQQSWMAMKRRKQPLWTRSKLLVSSILALAHRQSLALGRTPGKHGVIIEATTKNTTRRKMQLEAVHEKKKEIKADRTPAPNQQASSSVVAKIQPLNNGKQ
ncbi:unnamed protein product [Pylaiella littoralis]